MQKMLSKLVIFLFNKSSKIKEDGNPFNNVLDSILETISVNIIPKSTKIKIHNAETMVEVVPRKVTSNKYCT